MDVKQDQAIKRLLKKLSALRATLKNDERKMLDQLVIGSVNEVEAHTLSQKSPFTAAKAAKGAKDASEVEAHTLSQKSPFTAAKAAKGAKDASEVEAHSMDKDGPRLDGFNVVYDVTKDEYRID